METQVVLDVQSVPDVQDVIVGRYTRFPPLYYEMRLQRAVAQVKDNPGDLHAYDAAALACDRLRRSEEAIQWMVRKRARLEETARPPSDEQWYLYHANLGTILANYWLNNRQSAELSQKTEQARDQAREQLAQAVALRPDAHFGREKYLLLLLQWSRESEKQKQKQTLGRYLQERLETGRSPLIPLSTSDYAAAVKGLSGLVVLGNEWEIVDVFAAMGYLLQRSGSASPGSLATLRSHELIAAYNRSLGRGAPQGAEDLIKELRFVPLIVPLNPLTAQITAENQAQNKRLYAALRADADMWQEYRMAYVLERRLAGLHPDMDSTDKAFWKDLQDLQDLPPVRERHLALGTRLLESAKKQVQEAKTSDKKYWESAAKLTYAEQEREVAVIMQKDEIASHTISLLGKLQVEEAIPFLLENLGFQDARQDNHHFYYPYRFPCMGALIALGLPAADATMRGIEEASKSNHSLARFGEEVLARTLGPRAAAGYIQDRIDTLTRRQKSPHLYAWDVNAPGTPPVPVSVCVERLEAVRVRLETNAKLWASLIDDLKVGTP